MNCKLTFTVLALAAMAGCTPTALRVNAGAAMTQLKGDFALQNSAGTLTLANQKNSLDDTLGSGDDETSLYLRGEMDWGAHRVKISGFNNKSDTTGVLTGAFGDIPGGTAVTSAADFGDITGSWSYDLLDNSSFRLAAGAQVGFHSLSLSVRSTSPAGYENVETNLISPMPYLEFEWDLGPALLGVNGGGMQVDLRDANSRYWDAEAYVRIPFERLELIGGYRYISQNADGRATGRDFDTNYEVMGFFFGGGIHF
jgi:hypothetical protein